MKICLLGLVLWSTVALASSRIYDVAPWRNSNGWSDRGQFVSETFLSDVDSSLTWIEAFVGAPNSGGTYEFRVYGSSPSNPIFGGHAFAGDSIHYQFRRAELTRLSDEPIVRGKEYTLKVYHSGGEALNFYYDPDPATRYQYGHIAQPAGLPDTWCLAARIEGVNKGITNDVAAAKAPDLSVDSVWTEPGEPTVGASVRFFARVMNRGAAPWRPIAGRHLPLAVFTVNGDRIAAGSDLPLVRVGGSAIAQSSGLWPLSENRDYLVCAEVNDRPRLAIEQAWDNNARYRMYHVP